MTREEAIQMLRLYEVNDVGEGELGTWYNGIDKDMREALDMAIMALKESEVLSDKDLVIDHLVRQLSYVKPDWVLADRVLPNIDEEVIISVCDDSADNSYYYTTTGWLCHDTWISNNERVCGQVIAWAPLPKQYKEI